MFLKSSQQLKDIFSHFDQLNQTQLTIAFSYNLQKESIEQLRQNQFIDNRKKKFFIKVNNSWL